MNRNMRRKKKKKLICILTGEVANDGDDSYDGEYTDDYIPMDGGVDSNYEPEEPE